MRPTSTPKELQSSKTSPQRHIFYNRPTKYTVRSWWMTWSSTFLSLLARAFDRISHSVQKPHASCLCPIDLLSSTTEWSQLSCNLRSKTFLWSTHSALPTHLHPTPPRKPYKNQSLAARQCLRLCPFHALQGSVQLCQFQTRDRDSLLFSRDLWKSIAKWRKQQFICVIFTLVQFRVEVHCCMLNLSSLSPGASIRLALWNLEQTKPPCAFIPSRSSSLLFWI